jgi:uncharacterized protein (DUF1501 family)
VESERQTVQVLDQVALLARRSSQAQHWDSHKKGHKRAKTMKEQIDAPVAQLVLDLEARGLLDRTLVVLAASEFGDATPSRKGKSARK